MSFEQQLDQKQQQKTILSINQMQGLEILAMNREDLISFVTEEQLSNPLLELDYVGLQKDSMPVSGSDENFGKDYGDIPDDQEVDLKEYLISQIPQKELSKKEALLLIKVLDYIDNSTGYFSESIEVLSEELEEPEEHIKWAVEIIRTLEPAGIGAFNLGDCLGLQLKRMGKMDNIVMQILDKHLDDIGAGKISSITRSLKISTRKVKEYIALIRQLDPKPVAIFGKTENIYIFPDVKADYFDGKWHIDINGINRKTVFLNNNYIKMAKEASEPELINYFSEKISRAKNIVQAIEQREDTLKRMFEYVLNIQKDYVLGLGKMKPLTQKKVAEMLEVHPSTINRAVKDKYIQLPGGVWPVKELFTKKKVDVEDAINIESMSGINFEKQDDEMNSLNRQERVSPMCLIAPTNELLKQNSCVCARYNKYVDAFLASVPDACQIAEKLSEKGAEIFISRKGTRRLLEERGLTTIEIGLGLTDYIPIMEKASMIKGTVAFFSYGMISEDIRSMNYLLGIDAKYYSFHKMDECRSAVTEAIQDGAVLGVGGADSAEAAAELGLEHLTVENSEQSLLKAIESAEQLLQLKNEDAKKAEKLKIQLERYDLVFSFTHDAIIAVNEEGIISVLNTEAEKILRTKKEVCIGQPINKILPNTKLYQVLSSGKNEINQLMNIGGIMVSTNRVPIIVDGKIRGAVATFQDVKTIQKSEKKLRVKLNEKGLTAKYHFSDIIAEDPQMISLIRMAGKFAKSNATILIYGDTGVGKELFAQSIHNDSLRSDGPFVAVNCGSLPKNILEAELFGYAEGAFTGAVKGGKMGLFEMAHGGTIFLDEIGEMPLETQVQLLRVLQEKEIRRLGSDRVVPVDIRVITATNRDLPKEIAEGRFREDLYYRLNVLNLEIPPLCERGRDAELIGLYIYESFMPCTEDEKQQIRKIFRKFSDYTWPGNVREVHNLMERIYVLRSQNESFEVVTEYIERFLQNRKPEMYTQEPPVWPFGRFTRYEQKNVEAEKTAKAAQVCVADHNLEDWEKNRILSALQDNHLEMSKTAQALGISRSTLWRKIKKYNIKI